jgi:two-component sensor histidine kinase
MRYCRLLLLLWSSFAFGQSPDLMNKVNLQLAQGKGDTATVTSMMVLGQAFLDRPESLQPDMQMAAYLARRIDTLSRRLHYPAGMGVSKLLQAKMLRESGHAKDGRKVSEEAVQLLHQYGTPRQQAEAIIELGGTYGNTVQELGQKIKYYQQGAAFYKQMGDSLSEAKLMEFIGDLLTNNEQYTEALVVLKDATRLYQQLHFRRMHGIYSVMADTYRGLNDFTQSIRYNLMAIEAGEKVQEMGPLMTTIYNRTGINYFSVNYYNEALECFGKARMLALVQRDTNSCRTMLINISDALRAKGQYAASVDSLKQAELFGPSPIAFENTLIDMVYLKDYMAMNDPVNAELYFRKLSAEDRRQKLTSSQQQFARLALVSYLQSKGQFAAAVPLLKEYTDHLDEPLSVGKRAEGAYMLFRTDSALGHTAAALNEYKQYKMYYDSLTNLNMAKQMGIAKLQYEIAEKDKSIELLTQGSRLKAASLKTEKLWGNVFLVGIVVLVILLALIINRYRIKQRSNQQLRRQEKQISQQQEVLKKLLGEKEWLLKEVHHRVKNNLSIIIGLLNSQSEFLNNVDAKSAIRTSQNRMFAMSLIHQRLYQTNNLGKVDMKWYIGELINSLQGYFEDMDRIRFETAIHPILLDTAQAVPIALIINEAITNSIKYAFPAGRKGTIQVLFKMSTPGRCLLQLSDDGAGLPADFDEQHVQSLGINLMRGLAEQLDGDFQVYQRNGVVVSVSFPLHTIDQVNDYPATA